MLWRKCISLLLVLKLCYANYSCDLNGKNVSCTSVHSNLLTRNISVRLSKEDSNAIEELRLTNSSILVIEEDIFTNFEKLQRLYLKNTRTRYVAKNAFANLINLKEVYITDNFLEEVNSNAFSVVNSVQLLDLSINLINDLSNFDIDLFPSLSILNISDNRLEYLPDAILNKLKDVNDFYLIVDNNPWNCDHPKWVNSLTDTLVAAFCTGKLYDPQGLYRKMQALENFSLKDLKEETNECTTKCSFFSCLWWIFGAMWMGIIVGNIFKIKDLLFTRPKIYTDKNTQCGMA